MGIARTVFFRELNSSLLSPVRYLSLAAFFSLSSSIFCAALQFGEGKYWSMQTLWLFSVALPLPVLCSLLAMPLFAGERAAGTYEALSMLALPMKKVLIGKFAATCLSAFFAVAGSVVPWLLVSHTLKGRAPDFAVLHAPLVLLALHSFSWTALGTFSSAISPKPWLATVGTLFLGAAINFAWSSVSRFWFSGNWLSASFPVVTEIFDAAGGNLALHTIAFHVLFGLLALFFAEQILEVKR